MIRTAILAGLLLVMLSIAYTHLGLQPDSVRDAAALLNEPPPVKAPAPSAAPRVKHLPAAHKAEPLEAETLPAPQPAPAHEAVAPIAAPTVVKAEPAPIRKPVIAEAPVEPKPAQVASVADVPHAPRSLLIQPETPAAPSPAEPAAPAVAPSPNPVPQPAMTKVEDMPLIKLSPHPIFMPRDLPLDATHTAAPLDAATLAEEAPKFMSPQERSRELYRLAREMEDLFITKLAH